MHGRVEVDREWIVLSASTHSLSGVFPLESSENDLAVSSQFWKSPFVITPSKRQSLEHPREKTEIPT